MPANIVILTYLQVIFGYCRYHGAPIEAGEAFLLELHGEWGALTTSVPRAAQKVWTSFKKFKAAFGAGGIEFCSLWSDVIRHDQASLAVASAVIARALNQNPVSRPAAGQDRAAALVPKAFPHSLAAGAVAASASRLVPAAACCGQRGRGPDDSIALVGICANKPSPWYGRIGTIG
jgi:hypothetical protein